MLGSSSPGGSMLGGGKVHISSNARGPLSGGTSTSSEGCTSVKLLALLALVLQTVSLTMLMRYTRVQETETRYLSSTAVVLSELLKMTICMVVLFFRAGLSVPIFFNTLKRDVLTGDAIKLIVPAFLYSIQNNLLYLALSNLDTATYNVTYQLKTLTTAMFSKFMLKKRLSKLKWFALFLLVTGVSLVQLHDNSGMESMRLQRLEDKRSREAAEWDRVRQMTEEDRLYDDELAASLKAGQPIPAADEATAALNLQGPKIIARKPRIPSPPQADRPLSPREIALQRKAENEERVKALLAEQRDIENDLILAEMEEQQKLEEAELERMMENDDVIAARDRKKRQEAAAAAAAAANGGDGQPAQKDIKTWSIDQDVESKGERRLLNFEDNLRVPVEPETTTTTVIPLLGGHTDNRVVGFIAVVLCSFSSGFAGVYFEKVLKKSRVIVNIWARNVQLTFFGILFSLLLCMYEDGTAILDKGFLQGYTGMVWLVVVNNALGGLVVAMVVQYADQILKSFAMSVATVVVCLLSMWIWDFQPSSQFVLGTICVMVAVLLYSSGLKGAMGPKRKKAHHVV